MESMTNLAAGASAPRAASTTAGQVASREPYVPPVLERLGEWSALTLQQSIPIFP